MSTNRIDNDALRRALQQRRQQVKIGADWQDHVLSRIGKRVARRKRLAAVWRSAVAAACIAAVTIIAWPPALAPEQPMAEAPSMTVAIPEPVVVAKTIEESKENKTPKPAKKAAHIEIILPEFEPETDGFDIDAAEYIAAVINIEKINAERITNAIIYE